MPSWANQQKCNICENYFANSKCLKKHIQSVHDKFKPFICNICGHKTARKAMLDVCMNFFLLFCFLNKLLLNPGLLLPLSVGVWGWDSSRHSYLFFDKFSMLSH